MSAWAVACAAWPLTGLRIRARSLASCVLVSWALASWALLAGLLCVPAAALAADAPAVPTWKAPVMDLSNTLEPARIQALTARVRDLEQAHGAQLFVLLVPTTGSDSIEQYARRVFDQWAVGRKSVDDGVLLLVALQDRRVRIEVGYGLEGALTDVVSGRIIREQITPLFASGDYAGGVSAGVDALAGLIAGESLPPPPEASGRVLDDGPPLFMLLPLAALALVAHPVMSAFLMGAFVLVVTGSPLWAVLAALAGLGLSLLGRALGWAQRFQRRGRARRDRFGGGDEGGFGGGGFGGGGGSSGGGGGRGGGGGASGSW